MSGKAWRDQVIETALEPDLPIVDAHHHIWIGEAPDDWELYEEAQLFNDLATSGHRVVATVYVDSHSAYRTDGPEEMKYVGETEFAEGVGQRARQQGGAVAGACAAIVTHANMMLGAEAGAVLDAHMSASPRFRGIRHMTAYDARIAMNLGGTGPGQMLEPAFKAGLGELARRGLTFDAWLLQHQLDEFIQMARACPDVSIVLDHLGGPITIGSYAGRDAEALADWKRDIARAGELPNVVLKIGALNMGINNGGAVGRARPFTSDEACAVQRDYVLSAIDAFGPDRCLFESNFPVDMRGISYTVLWNTFKRITSGFAPAERHALFAGTAARTYRITL